MKVNLVVDYLHDNTYISGSNSRATTILWMIPYADKDAGFAKAAEQGWAVTYISEVHPYEKTGWLSRFKNWTKYIHG